MKILFICDWDFCLLWHPIAKKLKESGLADECVALVVGRNFYDDLKQKEDGVFDKIYLMQDEVMKTPPQLTEVDSRLSELEKIYNGSTLWRFVWADRSWVKCRFDEIKKRLIVCFDFFERLYSTEKPALVLTNSYASMPHLISYEVGKKHGMSILRPISLRLEDRYIISDNAMEEESWIKDYFTNDQSVSGATRAEVERFVNEFRKNSKKPAYQALRAREHQVNWGHLYRFLRYIYRYWVSRTLRGDHSKANPFRRLWSEVAWRIRRAYWVRPNRWDSYDTAERYVYFPLHVQPEMSTMTLAPFYLDQLAVLENLSKSLPINCRLVVKEHPSMLGRRSAAYYERIFGLPNVRFVAPLVDSFVITKNAAAVFTITGTAGLEGLIMQKPVIVLGSTYYRFCPLVIDAMNVAPTDWPRLISHALSWYKHDEEALITFLGAVFERSFRGIYVEPLAALDQVLAESNLDTLIDQIKPFITANLDGSDYSSRQGQTPKTTVGGDLV